MTDFIRYAWGRSSLGGFVAAISDRGLIGFEFADTERDASDILRTRFPAANLVHDTAGLASIANALTALVDTPAQRPEIDLDERGSDFERWVWAGLRAIPPGKTTTYGELTAQLGLGRDPRGVTIAIASNPLAILNPCHRVVKKDGSLSGYRWGVHRKRELLRRELRHERATFPATSSKPHLR